ncbi:hypothetical protein EVAR_88830_1 [Eumeta japonica]|uniref:Uncharacterized protein n=1 Tax=Eumeta variegata TaxID=151549 RepID=A0A4C1Y448_EUMVA|nr:hypothetical protein EVAR_88830_1 [Eumeta japonica]
MVWFECRYGTILRKQKLETKQAGRRVAHRRLAVAARSWKSAARPARALAKPTAAADAAADAGHNAGCDTAQCSALADFTSGCVACDGD